MVGRALSIGVRATAIVTAVGTLLACTSCSYGEEIHSRAVASAERGLALGLEHRAGLAGDLLGSISSASDIQAVQLRATFDTVLSANEASTPPPVTGSTALYGLESDAEEVTFTVFFNSGESASGGGVSVNLTRYACADLVGHVSSTAIAFRDTACPPMFNDWGLPDTGEVSLEALADRGLVDLPLATGAPS